MSKYIVKKAVGTVGLSNDWNASQWANANVLELRNYMGDKPEHFPKTQAKLLYDEQNIYVFFRVEDRYVKAFAESINDSVCQDSCVEFFFTPGTGLENTYLNLEINCGGTILFHHNDKNNNVRTIVENLDCEKIAVSHSLPKIIKEEIQEPTTWTLSYKLPYEVISKYSKITTPRAGVEWKANFYKCADQTSHPHWLTWAPVDNLTPNFHLPEFFGILEFE